MRPAGSSAFTPEDAERPTGIAISGSAGWLWQSVNADGDGTRDDENLFSHETEIDIYTLGGQYVLAPGLKFYAEYDHIEVDREFQGVAFENDGPDEFLTAPPDEDNEGNLFMLGAQVSF